MAGRTKLYQRPRSPLIEGHSKRERPFWQPWIVGVAGLLAWIAAGTLLAASGDVAAGGSIWDLAEQALPAGFAWLAVGGLLGSGVGVRLAAAWGMRRRWIVAVIIAIGGGYACSWFASLVGLAGR